MPERAEQTEEAGVPEQADVVVVGGGHNALVAAALLAGSGRRVVVLEATGRLGGAVASGRPFRGVDARLSRFSYLVSLFPEALAERLGLTLRLASRGVASYTPVGDDGLLVERPPGPATSASFGRLAPGDEAGWRTLEERLGELARVVAPTLLAPLPRAGRLAAQVEPTLWRRSPSDRSVSCWRPRWPTTRCAARC